MSVGVTHPQLRPTVQARTEVNVPAFILDVLITIQEGVAGLEIRVVGVRVSTTTVLSSGTKGNQCQANDDEQPGELHSNHHPRRTPITMPFTQTKAAIGCWVGLVVGSVTQPVEFMHIWHIPRKGDAIVNQVDHNVLTRGEPQALRLNPMRLST